LHILLRTQKSRVLFNEGEIWWCRIGMNVGVEIFGKGADFARPVLVLKKFGGQSFFGIPLTSNKKEGNWYVPIICEGVEGSAILNQARNFDARRLAKKMERLGDERFQEIKRSFLDFYGS
jgi:mRNA interferase MazF